MNIKLLTKIGIISGSILVGGFVLILLLPLCLNFFIDKYTPQIAGEINKLTGLSAGLEEIRIVVTPKLTAGLKVKKFELYTPKKEPVLISDNFQVKMSLLPLLAKNIRIDVISLNNADLTLKFDKNGDLGILQYLPKSEENEQTDEEKDEPAQGLPFDLKLSNHLPDIHVGEYKITVTDGNDNYVLSGGKTDITDFIINKSVKIKGSGKFVLKDREQFSYNLNLFNKIMPDIDLNELVFESAEQENKAEPEKIDVINILRGLYEYKVTASADVDLKTSKDSVNGFVNLDKISLIDLPESNAKMNFKNKTINLSSEIHTAKNEKSSLSGIITTGEKPYTDINLKSDLDITNALNIVKKIALIFNIKDLQTLTASGRLNADFNFKSDLKSVKSNGFLKIPSAKLYYGIYNVGLDNINADILTSNNNVNVKNISFSILGQPLKIYGTLSSDAVADIHAIADKLSVKGLLIAAGQAALMKENPVYSGTVTMDALIKGKLDKINPVVKLDISNLDLKNIPADLRLKAPQTTVNITSDGKTFGGNAESRNVKLVNPALTVSADIIKANIQPEQIEIIPSVVWFEKNKTTISGKILNYLTEKIGLDFVSSGDIQSTLKGDLNIPKQTLNLTYATTDLSTIVLPFFDRSKLSFTGKINITGNMSNPIITGNATVPVVSIPEIPVTMSDMDLKLNGTILHGSGTVEEFTSGGIKAQNLSSDFVLKGMDFYLNNLKGNAFGGKINGDIVYNLSNAKTKITFKGFGMDAKAAIEGGSGIKDALSGTLDFNTSLSLTVLEYSEMIKSMKGNLDFDIKKGAFGTIGRFEGFLGASNITQNYLLKNTVNALSDAAGLATTAQFDTLNGKLTFSDGWADLNPVKSAGKSLCYYITGKYNINNGTTNVAILGRLDAPMVAKLGALGTLNMSTILGDKAASVLKILTSNPQGEKTSEIPDLTNGSKNYQDFKVTFNGGVESKSSIKTFKWLQNADMTDLKPQTAKDIVDTVKDAYKTDIKTAKEEITNTIEAEKKKINDTKQQIKTTQEDFKNLWNNIKDISKSSSKTQTQTQTAPAAEQATQTIEDTAKSAAQETKQTQTQTQTSESATPAASDTQQEKPAEQQKESAAE